MVTCRFVLISLPFFFIVVFSAVSQLPDQNVEKKTVRILSRTLIGDDGRVYACSDNDFFSFESNGSIAWSVHMNFKCNTDLAPVYSGLNQMLVLAENRILRVNFPRNGTKSEPELFFDPGEPILGFAVSISSSSVYITVKKHGLYAYNMLRQQLWIAEPKIERFGYRLGCRKDYDNCTFDSPPVIDSCEGSIYISNNEGELYSLSLRGTYYQWIQDFSLVDRFFTVTPGNNGLVYVVFPRKSLVYALDSFSGDILWQKTVGPLAETSGSDPVIDSNSWVSIGSLDGTLYSFSRIGELYKIPKKTLTDSMIQIEPVLDCSGYAVYVSQTKLQGKIDRVVNEDYTYVSAKKPETAVFSLVVPETRSIHWSQSYSDQIAGLSLDEDVQHFVLDERIVLAFVAASNSGNPFRCRSKHEKLSSSCSFAEPEHPDIYIGNERAIIWFILLEFVIMIIFAALVRFCFIFWKKKKLQGRPFSVFLDKRRLLHRKRREIDRTVSKLQNESTADEFTVDQIGELVQERENVKRKLSSTYSLGRDIEASKSKSKDYVLPLYGGGSRSFSFRNRENESITIFQTPNDESSSEESHRDQQYNDDDAADDEHDEDNSDHKQKGKLLAHSEGSSNDGDDDESYGIASGRKRSIYLKKRSLSLTTTK
ncbi:PREDICTED: protein GAMETE EXPRESSED 3-like [Camelina sativa]|uniref:Protein GAMETE EXPRESSED 3-like n=1 Tax=Camelina sativa TaxID=90675 RepID=A0ABM0VI68_CAMSA|nr:PREDICTED: protein GAMETE EXPRESSED 3-like [Camelina sativa]